MAQMGDSQLVMERDRRRLPAIDVLRALAALAVVVYHVPRHLEETGFGIRRALLVPLEFGYLGVPLFLVISGFCIHLAAAGRLAGSADSVSWSRFWKRRFFRLYPAYVAAGILSLGLYLALGPNAYVTHERITNLPCDVITHLFLIHNLFRDYSAGLGNGPFWTLGLEEQLYALYFLYLVLRRRFLPGQILPWTLLLAIGWRWGIPALWAFSGVTAPSEQVIGSDPLWLGAWKLWPPAHWFAWLLGATAAEAYTGAIRLPRLWKSYWTAAVCFVLSACFCHVVLGRLIGSNWVRPHASAWVEVMANGLIHAADSIFAVGCFVVVNRWVMSETSGETHHWFFHLLSRLGLVSYSLYLTHDPVIHLLEQALAPDRSGAGILFRYVVYPPVCIGVALGFYWIVERHFLNRPTRAVRKGSAGETIPASDVTEGLGVDVPTAARP